MVELKLVAIRPGEAFSLEIWNASGSLAHIILEAPELTDLIRVLGDARASLFDGVAADIDPGTRQLAVLDPAWRTPDAHPEGYRALSLRHPGLGWLGFAFPEAEAAAIALAFQDPAARTVPVQPGDHLKTFQWVPTPIEVIITKHASTTLAERKISEDWLRRAVVSPDFTEPDQTDEALVRHFKAIPERDGRVLRVVLRPQGNGFKVITAFFDRSKRQ